MVEAVEDAYHEEGWVYDLTQVKAPLACVSLVAAAVVGTVLIYLHKGHITSVAYGFAGWGHGVEADGRTAIGGFLTVLTPVLAIVSTGVGVDVGLDNTHRVRELAYACAALSAALFVGFIAWAIAIA